MVSPIAASQARHGEPLRRHRAAEQIPVREEKRLVPPLPPPRRRSATDRNCGLRAKLLRQALAKAAPRRLIAPPSIATMISREATPWRSCSTSSRCDAVGASGRNADRSVEYRARMTTSAAMRRSTAQTRIAAARRVIWRGGPWRSPHRHHRPIAVDRIDLRPSARHPRAPAMSMLRTSRATLSSNGTSSSCQSGQGARKPTLNTCSSALRFPASVSPRSHPRRAPAAARRSGLQLIAPLAPLNGHLAPSRITVSFLGRSVRFSR